MATDTSVSTVKEARADGGHEDTGGTDPIPDANSQNLIASSGGWYVKKNPWMGCAIEGPGGSRIGKTPAEQARLVAKVADAMGLPSPKQNTKPAKD